MSITRLIIFALSALALQACRLGPDYKPVKSSDSVSGPFVSQAKAASSGTSREPLPRQWWRLYADERMNAFAREALNANYELKEAVAHLTAAQAVLSEAKAGRYPVTTEMVGASYGRSVVGNVVASSLGVPTYNDWTYAGEFDVSYEFDLFGRVERSIRAARSDTQAVEAVRDSVALAVVSRTMDAYIQICADGKILSAARQSLDIARRSRQLIQSQETAGVATRFDLVRADVIVASAESNIPDFEGRQRASLFELSALLGRNPHDAPMELLTCNSLPRPKDLIPTGDGAALLQRRPDVRMADRELQAAIERVGVAKAELYPRITFAASVSETSNRQLTGATAFAFGAGPLISWSFPNLAIARARLRASQANADGALDGFQNTVLQALKETEQALSVYGSELDRHEALARALSGASEAMALANGRYRAGELSVLDLITTEQASIDATLALASSDARLGADQVNLFRALGGGWEASSP